MHNLSLNIINNNSKASRILDMLRFFSALVVFLFHFYIPLPGYQAVMVFFVLSGYFISSTILSSMKKNRWSWPDYLLKRLTRLWIVLIPSLILTLMWGKIQLSLFGAHNLSEYLDFKTFLGNLFFLQGIMVKPYGLNGPLWSLSYEFWYYILFPCLILLICSPRNLTKMVYAFVFILTSVFVGKRIISYFLLWLLGALIVIIKPLKLKNKFINHVILILSFLAVLFSMNYKSSWETFFPDLRVGIASAIFIYLVISIYNDDTASAKFSISKQLAGFSYTLYLTHYPLATLITVWRFSPLWPFTKTTLLVKAVFAISVFLFAFIIALCTEKHTDRIRKILGKCISGSKAAEIKLPLTDTR